MSPQKCNPQEIALKNFFLGPQAENGAWMRDQLIHIMNKWFSWRRSMYSQDGCAISAEDQELDEFKARRELSSSFVSELLRRYEAEVPKFSPRYIGHMFSEISLPALLGHVITLLHNPNNISGESSIVGVQIEDEAVKDLLRMIGFSEQDGVGHFTSGGTIANIEALLRARERCSLWLAAGAASNGHLSLFEAAHMGWTRFDQIMQENPGCESKLAEWRWTEGNPMDRMRRLEKRFQREFHGPIVLVPENKHYSWKKGVSLLGLGDEAFWPIRLGTDGKLDPEHLASQLEAIRQCGRPILMVVSVAGTTELGEVDPVDQVQNLLDQWRIRHGFHIWHHVDAAYGGFFRSLGSLATGLFSADVVRALKALDRVDSVTLDPHKLGYVPYACGAFLVRQMKDYYVKIHVKTKDAPYLDFDATIDRGPYTVEGSRSAAGAAATWMTARCIGFDENGYGRILARTVRIRQRLEEELLNSGLPVRINPCSETNILCFTLACEGELVSISNQRAIQIFQRFSPRVFECTRGEFFVSKTALRWGAYEKFLNSFISSWNGKKDAEELVLVRLCLMNPFFDSVEMKTNFFSSFVSALSVDFT